MTYREYIDAKHPPISPYTLTKNGYIIVMCYMGVPPPRKKGARNPTQNNYHPPVLRVQTLTKHIHYWDMSMDVPRMYQSDKVVL